MVAPALQVFDVEAELDRVSRDLTGGDPLVCRLDVREVHHDYRDPEVVGTDGEEADQLRSSRHRGHIAGTAVRGQIADDGVAVSKEHFVSGGADRRLEPHPWAALPEGLHRGCADQSTGDDSATSADDFQASGEQHQAIARSRDTRWG